MGLINILVGACRPNTGRHTRPQISGLTAHQSGGNFGKSCQRFL